MYYPVSVNHASVRCRQYYDIDQQAEQLENYHQQYQQLDGGKFKGTFLSCHFDNELALYFEYANCGLLQNLAVPAHYYSIALVLESAIPLTFNGRKFTQGSVFLLPPQSEITVSSKHAMNVCLIHIASHLLDTTELPFMPHHQSCLVDNGQHNRALYSLIGDFLSSLFNSYFDFNSNKQRTRFKRAMASIIDWHFSHDNIEHYANQVPKYNTHRKREAVMYAKALIDECLGYDIDIQRIAQQTHVCRRTLEHYFLEQTNMSLSRYIKIMRFNGIRRDIWSSERCISDIASTWGIWHLGRFAQEYHQLFGELPSQTKYHAQQAKR